MHTVESQQARTATGSQTSQSLVDFARWAIGQLQLDTLESPPLKGRDGTQLHVPEGVRALLEGREKSDLSSELDWLSEQLRGQGIAVHARPSKQPLTVHALASQLFAAYQVDGGQVHLGGCHLENHPFLRLTYTDHGAEAKGAQVYHVYVAADGSSVSQELLEVLGLDAIQPVHEHPPRLEDGKVAAMASVGRRTAAQHQAASSPASQGPAAPVEEPLATTLIWVKYATGQLQFTVGDQSVQLPFEGWAKTLTPKPYPCPLTNTSSFHLAATDEGPIVPAEEIQACAKSGKRVLRQELVACHVTGEQVLPEYVDLCPVSGQPTLLEEFATCPACQQRVSQVVLTDQGCDGCDRLPSVSSNDPRLVWILGEHTGLSRWKHWRLGETETMYIAQATSLMQRLMVLVDRETLTVQHMARRSRFASTWTPVEKEQWQEYLN